MLRAHFPWMTTEEEAWLRDELMRRAALGFEQAELWRDAAECWAALGEHGRAGELYARGEDLGAAASALLTPGRYAEALALYQRWEASLPEGDVVNRVQALLGQAACHLLGTSQGQTADELSRPAGQQAYRRARALMATEAQREGWTAARCYAALGEYGARLNRFDLAQQGYERALVHFEGTREKIEATQAYLDAVRVQGDRVLAQSLEERLANWGGWTAATNWQLQREIIEEHPFGDGVHDVLHFTEEQQRVAWQKLAQLEDNPEVDDYMRTLAPPGMVYIPSGSFLMGSSDDDPDARANEKPQHEVWLRGYYIDRFPVTNAQYEEFINADGYERQEFWTEAGWAEKVKGNWSAPSFWGRDVFEGEQRPVVGVSWYEAVAYSNWGGKKLPSEAEWEKAASWDPVAKRKRKYPWGNEWDETKRIYDEGNWPEVGNVSSGKFNNYGVGDMVGLYNWCSSKERPYPYTPEDGREEEEGSERRRVRGGGSTQNFSRYEYRDWNSPGWRTRGNLGFRCVVPHTFSPLRANFQTGS